ncbi:MAG: hypothetical protein V9G21_02460 [Methylotenera sp.]|jgi:outer membrane protein OmpA-like peptidoglycan-associated protein|nr:hypothetical protein [Methylotenera sp.]HOY87829.1 hypothetical protein [Methylotenera sp.]HPH08954.1 hypothetical protein [Methylotenera sp.]HPM50306.1 hypothetical protein [Methylotenera sp.]HPV32167.1 hypothetical protein [Methylotenera sp.]
MSIETSQEDGADIFWPGYVDAIANLVLNLLFMLTIMIVAVFMFALELSRHKENSAAVTAAESSLPTPVAALETENRQTQVNEIVQQKDAQIQQLQQQLQAAQQQALVKNTISGKQKVVIAKTPLPQPDKELERTADSGSGVVVSFENDAVTLSSSEAETLRNTLAAIAANRSAKISVTVPKGFSEAKRLGFYRAMAVRNQLIEMKVPADKIDVVITEGPASANNARVLVTSR